MNTYTNIFQQYVNFYASVTPLLISIFVPIFMLYNIIMLERTANKYKRKYFTLKNTLLFNSDDELSELDSDDVPELVESDSDDTDTYDDMPNLLNADGTVYNQSEEKQSYDTKMINYDISDVKQTTEVVLEATIETTR